MSEPAATPPSLGRRLVRGIGWLALLLLLALAGIWLWARPATPDSFYNPPAHQPGEPGRLLRAEPLTRAVPAGAKALRILYTTTRQNGAPAVASALVYLPAAAGRPHPVIAWAHGTTGIAAGCAPSLAADPLANAPAVAPALAQGWALVAPDYPGLGTQGAPEGHAYLVGNDAARAVLDSVRAARQLPETALGPQTIVWGHSQGGHAALWTGILAPSYAPDVPLAGVAALAPASDLPALLESSGGNVFGKIVSAFVARSYPRSYPDIDPGSLVVPAARLIAADIAGRCSSGRPALISVAQTFLLPANGLFAADTAAFARRLAENSPAARIGAPLLVAQGEADDLVLPAIQNRYVAARCAAGQPVDHRRYPGLDHLTLVAPTSPLTADLIAWSRARLAGAPALSTCPPARQPYP